MKLKELRMLKGLSQEQLAEKSGVTVRMIRAYEQGTKNIHGAKLKTLMMLAQTLDVAVHELLSDEQIILIYRKTRF